MPFCLYAYMLIYLYAYICLYAYMLICLYAYMLLIDTTFQLVTCLALSFRNLVLINLQT